MTTKAARIFVSLVLALACPWLKSNAQESSSVEYKIKAAYMFNFANFVEWPAGTFPTPETPVILCVLGKDPFGSNLEKTLGDKSIAGRRLRIKRLEENSPVESCHLLFISSSERKRLPQLLQSLKGSSVLTIGETDQFLESGGMINFIKQENTIRFQINAEAAEKAGLKISSKLLQIGKTSLERGEQAQK
jgi:YfiR/HmsC-like